MNLFLKLRKTKFKFQQKDDLTNNDTRNQVVPHWMAQFLFSIKQMLKSVEALFL